MRHFLPIAFAVFPALTALPAQAQDQYWEFGAWRVSLTVQETTEHVSRTCRASTGGDGLPVLSITVHDVDAGPPTNYPAPTLEESAPRGHGTQVQNGQALGFVFDKQAAFYGIADGYYDADGFAQARVSPRWQDRLNMLRWMKAGQNIDIRTVQPYGAGEPVLQVSLAGFTAAYGKMMDECGFSIELVDQMN
ncbi:invasion associated locus B family protein [Pseudophaeobacter flagellatus]|uniref:hypothetical protein n=1 Tax=Pseudophaeobacter flagellatus TaxID=2899119 RepID=UPI001E4A1C8B|nr:hypothetical protein [Pseudophaeobacter flagellatus]MCD9149471.1 hypothetical protein [Pseudophaeobacter flagellatus]